MTRSLAVLLGVLSISAVLCAAPALAHAEGVSTTTSTSLGDAYDEALAVTPCSQPVSTGSNPTASDCLFLLKTAVGSQTCSPECICAPKGTLPTTASDALLCLKKAVGQAVTLACPCEGTTTTLPDTTTTTAGGGSIENGRLDYDARCSFCHAAGSYDTEGESASNLAGDGDKLEPDLGDIDGDMDGILFTGEQLEDMAAFLDSLQ